MPSGKGSKCHLTGKRRVCKIPSFELCTTVSFESHLPGMGMHGGRESGPVIGMGAVSYTHLTLPTTAEV